MNYLKTKTDTQLKKWNTFLLGIAIGILVLMVVAIGISLFQFSKGEECIWLSLSAPVIFGPLIIIALLFSSAISQELKKRRNSNS